MVFTKICSCLLDKARLFIIKKSNRDEDKCALCHWFRAGGREHRFCLFEAMGDWKAGDFEKCTTEQLLDLVQLLWGLICDRINSQEARDRESEIGSFYCD